MLLAAPSAASAAKRYASPSGSGTGCTAPNTSPGPCDLTTAITGPGANPMDEVIVEPGNYTVTTELEDTIPLVIHGVSGAPRPAVTVMGSYGLQINNAGTTVRHLGIIGGSGAGFALNAGGTIDDVIVRGSPTGIAACTFRTFDTVLRNSVCWGPSGLYQYGNGGGGVLRRYTLRNDTLIGGANGMGLALGNNSGGYNAEIDAFNVIARGGSADVRAGTDSSAQSGANVVLTHSNYAKTTVTGTNASVTPPTTSGNQTAFPVFVDLAHGNFRERFNSPTVDAGLNDALNGPTDADGRPRKIGPATDIGAYELPPDTFKGVTIKTHSKRVKKGKVAVSVRCPRGTPSPCVGKLTLTYKPPGKNATKKAGAASFSIPAAKTRPVKVKLSQAVLDLLKSHKSIAMTATAVATDARKTKKTTAASIKVRRSKAKQK